jgi:hypothetical protein
MAEQAEIQDPEPGQPEQSEHPRPTGRRGERIRRWTALGLVVILGCAAGGWFRAWSDSGLTAAQADQADVRLTLDGFALSQSNGCDQLGLPEIALEIPLHNYSPGPVVVRSIAVNPPGQAPGPAEATDVTMAAGSSATIQAIVPIQLCTANQATRCPTAEVELDATAVVVPQSGRVHEVRLPIAEWVPTKYLQLYEDAPFASWGSPGTCP